ncbi:MAG: hypothetical protein HQK79_01235 [Desulfobacterales bacterium]|nr:hypothetical protein [Desulfobacterales bacterium]
MNSIQKAYYQAFLFSLLVCLSPFKGLAYITPFLSLAWIILKKPDSQIFNNIFKWFCLSIFLIFIHAPFIDNFAFGSSIISIITYGSFAFIAIIPARLISSEILFERMLFWIKNIFLIEAFIGISQALYSYSMSGTFDLSNGDAVQGTIHITPAYEPSFSNPMFTANMVFLMIAILPSFILKNKAKIHCIVGSIAIILASVIHILIIFVFSFILSQVIYKFGLMRQKIFLTISFLFLCVISISLLESNFANLPNYIENMFKGEYPRSKMVIKVFHDIPKRYPLMPLIGFGPGQFSSRAGLIGTGMYLGGGETARNLPLFPNEMSKPFEEEFLDMWLFTTLAQGQGYGSTHQPHFSFLSVYTEFGAIFLFLIFLRVSVIILKIKKNTDLIKRFDRQIFSTSLTTGIFFVFFLGIQENYWEITQAIFPGLMILKILYANTTKT